MGQPPEGEAVGAFRIDQPEDGTRDPIGHHGAGLHPVDTRSRISGDGTARSCFPAQRRQIRSADPDMAPSLTDSSSGEQVAGMLRAQGVPSEPTTCYSRQRKQAADPCDVRPTPSTGAA